MLFDTPRTLEKLADLAAKVRSAGSQLAVFPEAFVGGYPKGEQFGVSLGRRTPEGRELFSQVLRKFDRSPRPPKQNL